MHNLVPHPTWEVQDSSKIQTYMSCPRKYFFEYVLGWAPDRANIHLEFGTAFHLAMAHLMSRGYTDQALDEAYVLFLAHYRKFFGPETDGENEPKNPACAYRALSLYMDQYPEDHTQLEILHVEVSGAVAVSPSRVIHFKTDTIARGPQGYLSLEHKTGSRFSSLWAAQWRQKFQVGTYTHVLFSLFPPEEVYGVIINGVFPHAEPRLKKDGQPYAGSQDTEFHRVIVRRTMESMQSWLWETNLLLDEIERDFESLNDAEADDPLLLCFRRNTENCGQYGNCPFLDYCSLWNNPLRYPEPPSGFTTHYWDPRTPEGAREKMDLTKGDPK